MHMMQKLVVEGGFDSSSPTPEGSAPSLKMSSQNSPFHYAHFPSCNVIPLTISYRPIYTKCLLSSFWHK